jgi:hypothetical protein
MLPVTGGYGDPPVQPILQWAQGYALGLSRGQEIVLQGQGIGDRGPFGGVIEDAPDWPTCPHGGGELSRQAVEIGRAVG